MPPEQPDSTGYHTVENGQGIQECLRGVLMCPIACVDDWDRQIARQEVRSS